MASSPSQPATYADLQSVSADIVAELIDGKLVTHPRPSPRHVTTAFALALELGGPFQKGIGGPGGWVFADEPELHLSSDVLVPDLAGWRRERFAYPATNYFTVPPDWVCEILSASTEQRDRTVKMRIYADAGISHLWLVDPRMQILEAFKLDGGDWKRTGAWRSDDEVRAAPFEVVAFSLADLWPADPPLGFNEDPQPLFAGDR